MPFYMCYTSFCYKGQGLRVKPRALCVCFVVSLILSLLSFSESKMGAQLIEYNVSHKAAVTRTVRLWYHLTLNYRKICLQAH